MPGTPGTESTQAMGITPATERDPQRRTSTVSVEAGSVAPADSDRSPQRRFSRISSERMFQNRMRMPMVIM